MPPRSGPGAGSDACCTSASRRLIGPATRPLIIAICIGSAADSLRDRLLSNSPAQAGASDEKCTPVEADMAARPGQDDCTGEDRGRSESDPSVDVLLEHEPSDRERGEALEVEQQCRGGSPRAGETQHQQHRSDDAAEQDHRRQPRQVRTSQRGFDCRCPEAMRPWPDKRQPEASAQIQDTREKPRIDGTEEKLGQGRARAEQRGGSEGEGHSGPKMRRGHSVDRYDATPTRS